MVTSGDFFHNNTSHPVIFAFHLATALPGSITLKKGGAK